MVGLRLKATSPLRGWVIETDLILLFRDFTGPTGRE